MYQTNLVSWLMHVAGSESLGQRLLGGHPFIRGTLQGGDNLLGGLINSSMRKGLKEQQLSSANRLISATHEVVICPHCSHAI